MKTSLSTFETDVELTKSSETYEIHDLKMENLVASTTRLHPGKQTRGHTHPGTEEEVYICLEGTGRILIDQEESDFKKGDLVTIPSSAFHRVINNSESDLLFLCIFEKYERE